MCVIADDRAVLGLGGVIGGEDTGVTDATTNVFIEFGLFRSEAHGAHRPEARHPVGRALQLRARRRSRFRRAGARACHRAGARALRRHAEQDHRRRQAAQGQQAVQIRSRPGQARLSGLELGARRDQAPARRARHRARRQGQAGQGRAAVLAPRHHRPRRSRRGGGAAHRRRQGAGDADAARGRRGQAGAHRGAAAAELTRRLLAARGLVEAVTWSFIPPEQAKLFGGGQAELTLSNPISTELAADAALAAAGADRRRAAKPRQGLRRRRPVRAWPSLSGRRARGSVRRRVRRSLRPLGAYRARAAIGRAKPLPPTFSPPRPMRSPRSRRSASTRRA